MGTHRTFTKADFRARPRLLDRQRKRRARDRNLFARRNLLHHNISQMLVDPLRNATYFPTYSQTENVVTNAVLVLMSQVHRLAPDVFSGLLTKLTDEEYSVGPQFFNQVTDTSGPGVPDGLIEQRPFQIYFETKLGDNLEAGQIKRHFRTIRNRAGANSGSVLIGLARSPIQEAELSRLRKAGAEEGITFASTTFSELANLVVEETADFRLELNTLIEEFRTFIAEKGLNEPSENWLLVNPCGMSFEQNAAFHVYHDQPWRSKRHCKYLGCYRSKAVRLIGKVRKIIVAHFEGNQIVVDETHALSWAENQSADLDPSDESLLHQVVNASPYTLRDETVRYYFVDRFVETEFVKSSRNGIRGHTYFQLDSEDVGARGAVPELFRTGEPEIDEIATALRGLTWT